MSNYWQQTEPSSANGQMIRWYQKYRWPKKNGATQPLVEASLSILVGLVAGAIFVYSLGLSSSWQGLILVIPITIVLVMLANNLQQVILAAIAMSVPLNLDISLIISPYARNAENLALGHRTLVTLTELRLSLVTILLAVGYALWLIENRHTIRFYAATTIPALGLIFISIISMFQAQDLQLALFQFVQLIELFLIYFYLVNHLRCLKDIQLFFTVFLIGFLAETVLMVVQWNTGLEFIIAGIEASFGGGRVAGTLGNAGTAGGYVSASLMIALAAIWVMPKRYQVVLAVGCIAVGLPALISTNSRAGWSGFAVTFLIFTGVGFWKGWMRRKALAVLFFGILILGALFSQTIVTRITEDDGGSAESRPKMYRLAWNVIQSNMWFGVGTNNYALVARDYYTGDVGNLGYVVDSIVHNTYLATWAETGLFGLIFYLAFLAMPVVQMLKYIAHPSENRFVNIMALGIGCGIISLSIQMFTGSFHMRAITLFVWLLPALMSSFRNLESTRGR